MDHPLFAALQENFGDGAAPPPDTSTVKGLLAFCKLWLEGDLEPTELHNPCLEMAGRLRAGALTEYKNLDDNPDLVESVTTPIRQMAEAYESIAELLEALPELAVSEEIDDFFEGVEAFETEREIVINCNEIIFRNLSGANRVCPRCGDGSNKDICPTCNLVCLYPTPPSSGSPETKTEFLEAPVYGKLYKAHLEVVNGEARPNAMDESLNELEKHLAEIKREFQQVAQSGVSEENNSEGIDPQAIEAYINASLDLIERAFAGAEQMRAVKESFLMSDITRGWEIVFDSAVELQRQFQHSFQSLVPPESEDQVQLSGGD